MTLRKFFAFYIPFVAVPLSLFTVYLTEKFNLSNAVFIFLLLSLSFLTITPPLAYLQRKTSREVERFINAVGFKETHKWVGRNKGVLIAYGVYKGFHCKLYELYKHRYSDELLILTVDLNNLFVNKEGLKHLKGLPKVHRVEFKDNSLEVYFWKGDIEHYGDILRVLNTVCELLKDKP